MITSITSAINAANHAADIVAGRLQVDLESLYEQVDELELMSVAEPLSPQDRSLLDKLKKKVLALDPYRAETMTGV